MSLFSKILLISLTIIGNSDCFLLHSYKLAKPSKLSRSTTPLYLSIKNKNSSNFLKLNDDDGSSSNNNNKLFNLSEYKLIITPICYLIGMIIFLIYNNF